MDAPRAVLATSDRDEALQALARLESAGIAGELVLSSPGFGENRFDAECGVDPLYPFNLLVAAADRDRAEALLAEVGGDHRVETAEAALDPEVEEAGPVRIGYDRPAFLAARVVLLIVFLTHLPRALLTAAKAPSRPAVLVLSAMALVLWAGWGAALAVVGGPALAAVWLGGIGVTVGLVDVLVTRRRFVLAFIGAEAVVAAAVVVWGLTGALP